MALYGGPVSIVCNGWRTIVRQRNRLESFNEQLENQVEVRTRQLTLAHRQLVEYADQAKELAVVRRVDGLGRVVDTNGDGVVNINDISAIASNFWLTSPLRCQ